MPETLLNNAQDLTLWASKIDNMINERERNDLDMTWLRLYLTSGVGLYTISPKIC